MNRSAWITALVLGLTIIGITVALLIETNRGPSFRAEDYDSLQECIASIPAEWAPGSMHRDGAEEACRYVHGRQGP